MFFLIQIIPLFIFYQRKKSARKGDEYIAKIKILTVMSISLALFLLIAVSDIVYEQRRESIHDDIERLFECEAKGTENQCSRDSFNSLYSVINATVNILKANLAVVLYIFLIDFQSTKKYIVGCLRPYQPTSSNLSLRYSSGRTNSELYK